MARAFAKLLVKVFQSGQVSVFDGNVWPKIKLEVFACLPVRENRMLRDFDNVSTNL